MTTITTFSTNWQPLVMMVDFAISMFHMHIFVISKQNSVAEAVNKPELKFSLLD
jgi:hypothetical protein